MGTLGSNCVRAIDDVLSGADPFSDWAVDCLQQMGRQATLAEAERSLLKKIIVSRSHNDPPYDHNQQKQYDRLELQALRLLAREIGPEVIPLCVSVLDRKVVNEFYCTWSQSAPAQTLDILQIAKQYSCAEKSVAAAVNALLSRLLPIIPGSGKTGYTNREIGLAWEQVGIECCRIVGDAKYPNAVSTLDDLLKHVNYDTDLLLATIDSLGEIGTDAAVDSIGKVFPFRKRSSGDANGYIDHRHDALCGRATTAILQIGTLYAFNVFVKQIDIANRSPIDSPWHSDVKHSLDCQISEATERNLISVLLDSQLSTETRSQLLRWLRRNEQTANLLENALRPSQPGFDIGIESLSNLREHLKRAAASGDEPGTRTYVRIEYPPHLDIATATRFQSLFSRSRLPVPRDTFISEFNSRLAKRGTPIINDPRIEGTQEVPLAHLRIDYPHKSTFSILKHAVLSRTDVYAWPQCQDHKLPKLKWCHRVRTTESEGIDDRRSGCWDWG